jgi:ATP-dependent helicase/nuclease subunit A
MSKSSTLVDAKTRARIESEFATNLLVEAGAGSGKTHEMASRMAAGVAAGAYDIEGMAAVTFTRKAAAELRGRFQLALEEQLKTADAAGASRIRATLSNLERFFAGTIHSFCAHLLRARPVEAGVSPGFTELDEFEDANLRKQAWRDFLVHERAKGNPLLEELREAGLQSSELDRALEVVCNDEDVEFPPGDAECPDVKAAWKALDKFWAGMEKLLPAKISPETTCGTQQACERFRRQLRVAATRRNRPDVIAQLLSIWNFTPKITQYQWADDAAGKKRAKEKVAALHEPFRADVVQPFITAWREYLYKVIVTLVTQARATAAAERRRRNTLNYNDLLLLAAKMLRENADVRHALQRKYRWLFVDEFQDTDPVQAEIIFLLAADEAASGGRFATSAARGPADWRMLPLRDGALFVVGDPKQSIYRFRRADIEIYNQVRARFEKDANADVVLLTANFRSVESLCNWANDVFKTKFPAKATSESPTFASLAPAPQTSKRSRPAPAGVCTLTIESNVDGKSVPREEAARIARYIRAEVNAGRRAWGDFLILTRKKSHRLLPFVQALENLQIPMEVSGAGAFAESSEVADLAQLLRALGDPQDSVSLVGVLRGRLFGISDPKLFEWKQANGWFSIFADTENDALKHLAVARAIETLARWYRWTRVLPIAAAIDKILEESGYLALAATTPAGVEAGDLLHAVDRVRQVAEHGGNLSDAAQALDEDLEAIGEVESLPLEPGRSDVVRLMNLHKAKGLEAAVVFLADPLGDVNFGVSRRIVRDGATARGWFLVDRPETNGKFRARQPLAQPADWDMHAQEEKVFLDAEETRLLYVAATRARDLLVVGRYARDWSQAWSALNPFLAAVPELPIPATVNVPQPIAVDVSTATRARAAEARRQAHERADTPSWSITSVTAEARHIIKMTRAAEPVAADDPTRVVVQDTHSHRADAGAAWGTLIHGLLEHAMRHEKATRDDLHRLAMWLTIEEPKLRTVIDEALDTVERVRGAEFWKSAQTSEHSVETPFMVAQDRDIRAGVIDLMHRERDGWVITDYKTDVDASVETANIYATQLESYRKALAACGVPVAGVNIEPVRKST